MTAAALLAQMRAAGISVTAAVTAEGSELRCRAPRGALTAELRDALRERKAELLELLAEPSNPRFETLHAGRDGSAAELFDRFLEDASVPLAVFHSKALDRDFVLARDQAAFEALAEEHRTLPVLFFADCEHGAALGREGLRVLLDLRQEFGPEVAVRGVRRP